MPHGAGPYVTVSHTLNVSAREIHALFHHTNQAARPGTLLVVHYFAFKDIEYIAHLLRNLIFPYAFFCPYSVVLRFKDNLEV